MEDITLSKHKIGRLSLYRPLRTNPPHLRMGLRNSSDNKRSFYRFLRCVDIESWFVSIRNQPNGTDSDERRWHTGLGFVTSVVTWVSRSQAGRRLQHIEERLHRLSTPADRRWVNLS